MKVIAGTCKGRRLCVSGAASIRPTTDKVREAVFDILTHAYGALNEAAFPFSRCLDLFAGSGAMGIEAMSRGAQEMTFVDDSPAAIKLIRQNLEICGSNHKAVVLKTNALAAIRRFAGQKRTFDLIFVDPPYESTLAVQTLRAIDEVALVSEDGVVVVETSKRASLNELALKILVLSDERRYGDTAVYFYRLRVG
ncbi:MAG: 16S rRNA (guanine(966)-N(2))-methyltransferase RsmD [Deltaproteobacteria bacterium]